MSSDGHFVSVVVPTLGRGTLDQCRQALERQIRPADEIVLVVDEERRGASWARSEGFRRSRGDLIVFTDDDCVPPPEWLGSLLEAIVNHDAAAAGGSQRECDPLLADIRGRRPLPERTQVDPGGLVGNTANVMYRRDWLSRLLERDGYLFHQSFPTSGEDWELAGRLHQMGAKMVYVPVHVEHLRQASPWNHCKHQFVRGIGIAYLARAARLRGPGFAVQKSMLWGAENDSFGLKWLRLIWHKVVGPFDVGSFRSLSHFGWFWLGEKFQGAGYLWAQIRFAGGAASTDALVGKP